MKITQDIQEIIIIHLKNYYKATLTYDCLLWKEDHVIPYICYDDPLNSFILMLYNVTPEDIHKINIEKHKELVKTRAESNNSVMNDFNNMHF